PSPALAVLRPPADNHTVSPAFLSRRFARDRPAIRGRLMSWQALEAIVRDGQSALAMPGLAEQVRRVQEAATPEERTRALATVADTIMATGDSTPWIVYLAAAENPVARHLAVLLAGRSIGSLPEEAMAAIRP